MQGDVCSGLCVLQTGLLDVVLPSHVQAGQSPSQRLLHTVCANYGNATPINPLSLFASPPQPHAIIARCPSTVWLLPRAALFKVASRRGMPSVAAFAAVPMLHCLSLDRVVRLQAAARTQRYEAGVVVVSKGDVMTSLCIVAEGQVRAQPTVCCFLHSDFCHVTGKNSLHSA